MSKQYRKKPVVIEAMRVGRTTYPDALEWMHDHGAETASGSMMSGDVEILIPTLEGVMTARVGDWIIRGVAGEFYPCKAAIFEATYEAVEVAV